MKGAGKFYGLGEAIDYTVEIASHKDKQFRFAMDMKVMNFDLKIVVVVNGDKGWEKINDDVKEICPPMSWPSTRSRCTADAVVSLLPLKEDKEYKLSTLGDVKVGDQPAVGDPRPKEGRRDVNLVLRQVQGPPDQERVS